MNKTDFPLSRLGSLTAKIGSGITPTGGESSYVSEGVALIRSQNVVDGWLDLRGVARITHEQHESMSNSVVRPSDVLLNITGASIGRTCIVPDDLPEANVSQHVCIIRCGPDLSPSYLFQYLSSDQGQRQIDLCQAGGNRQGLNYQQIAGFHVPLPQLPEQKAIASVLSSWDRGIRQLTDLIAAKLRFKQGLMQQLLTGNRRIPAGTISGLRELPLCDTADDSIVSHEVEFGITGKSFKEGIPSISSCPLGWTQHQFRDVLNVVERPAEIGDDDTYQLVTAKRYRGGIVPREQLRGDQIKTKTQFFVATGDFLISKRQIIHGACGMVPASLDGAVVSNEYVCLRPSSHLDLGFLRYLAHTRYFQQTCFHASVGVALEKMIFRLDQWLKHLVNLPPLNEQKAIAHCLSTMDREILLLARQRRLLKEQKKGMMQKLLTGEVRVKLPKGVV